MKRCFVITLLIGWSVLSFAQGAVLDTWFDLQRSASGDAMIQGMVVNRSSKAQAFSYSMQFEKSAPSGNTISTQSGSFTLLPAEEKSLSVVSVNLTMTSFFKVKLKIFDDERVVAIKEMVSDQQFLSDFQKLLPQQPIEKTLTAPAKKIIQVKKNATDALEIEGLIIDETRTKSGRDFYDQFYGKWVPPIGVSDFTITIRELPARGRAARVSVEVNGNVVIQRMIQPRLEIIELMAEQSINVVKKHLTDNEKLKNDLETGDQKGSGIF